MSEVVDRHRSEGVSRVRVAVLTVSDTRTMETDASGALIVAKLEAAGHEVVDRQIVRDEPRSILEWIEARSFDDCQAAILIGGTGISPRDSTADVVASALTKPLPGFGELFRMLSFGEIGPASMMSRAVGGLVGRLVVLALPGSRAGVELAMTKIIIPELPHLVGQARKV